MESLEDAHLPSSLSQSFADVTASEGIPSPENSQVFSIHSEQHTGDSQGTVVPTRKRKHGDKSVVDHNRDPSKGEDTCIWFVTVPALFNTKKSKKDSSRDDAKNTAFAEWQPFCDELLVAAEDHELHIYMKLIKPISFEELNAMLTASFGKHCNVEKPRRPDSVIKYCTKSDWPCPMHNILKSKLNQSYQLMENCHTMAENGAFDPTNPFIRCNVRFINLAKSITSQMIGERNDSDEKFKSFHDFKICQWMVVFLEWLRQKPTRRSRGFYLYGAPETYKTSFVNFCLRKLKIKVFLAEDSGKFSLQQYRGEKAIFLNDYDLNSMPEQLKLNLFENTPMRLPVKGGHSAYKWNATYNIVSSNITPEEGGWSHPLRTRLQVVCTDQLMMKVEDSVQAYWASWLDNGGTMCVDDVIELSDDEEVLSDPLSEPLGNPCACMGCAFGQHCGQGDCCDYDQEEDTEVEDPEGQETPVNSQPVGTTVEVPPESPVGEPERCSTPIPPLEAPMSLYDKCMNAYTPPDPGLRSGEESEEEQDILDFDKLSEASSASPPKRKRCLFIVSDVEESERYV